MNTLSLNVFCTHENIVAEYFKKATFPPSHCQTDLTSLRSPFTHTGDCYSLLYFIVKEAKSENKKSLKKTNKKNETNQKKKAVSLHYTDICGIEVKVMTITIIVAKFHHEASNYLPSA